MSVSSPKRQCKKCKKSFISQIRNGVPVSGKCKPCTKKKKKKKPKVKKPKKKTIKNKLDKVFSELTRSKGKCERCGSTETLQTSHIYSRSNLSVRWDTLNATCFCASCHWWWHKNPTEGTDWLRGYYTEQQYEELKQRANAVKKWEVWELEELLEELKEIYEQN